jgi:hypothetical protein
MSKNHDEKRDLSLITRNGIRHDGLGNLTAPKGMNIGIHTWGKIDFLTHHCGYVFHWQGSIKTSNDKKVIKRKKRSVYDYDEID